MVTNRIEDETSMVQFGQIEESVFYSHLGINAPKPTSWDKFPTLEKPDNKMKYASIAINLSKDMTIWNR